MNKHSRIYVSGHQGLLGSALVRALRRRGYRRLLLRSRAELDLTDRRATDAFLRAARPEYIFHAAAEVGGVAANAARPADFISRNLALAGNVIDLAFRRRVRRLVYFGCSCAYPKFAAVPIRETSLLTGSVEPSNESYAVAKIAGLKLCQAYNRQHGTDFITVIPANLYGPGDHFDDSGHVVAGLLRRFQEARDRGAPAVSVWGSGRPARDFLYVDDAAEACLLVMTRPARPPHDVINVGSGRETSIRRLARLIADTVGYRGRVIFDTSREDGIPRRCLDTRRIRALGWRPRTGLEAGLRRTCAWYRRTRPPAQ